MPICSNQSWSPPATRRESRTVCFVSLHSAVMIIRSRAKKLNFCQNAVKELRNKSSVGINESPRPPRLSRDAESRATILVAGALRLDVSRLLALVADLLTTSGLLGAVAGVVARLATVVALHAVDTLACDLVSQDQMLPDKSATYETYGRSHRKSSRSCQRHHRSHHHSCYRRRTWSSCGQYGQSHHTETLLAAAVV